MLRLYIFRASSKCSVPMSHHDLKHGCGVLMNLPRSSISGKNFLTKTLLVKFYKEDQSRVTSINIFAPIEEIRLKGKCLMFKNVLVRIRMVSFLKS